MSDLGRLITAMITPFDDKGEIDYEEAGHLATSLINSGSDGVIVSVLQVNPQLCLKKKRLNYYLQ